MTTLAPPTLTTARQFAVDRTDAAGGASQRRLLILGGLSGVAAGLVLRRPGGHPRGTTIFRSSCPAGRPCWVLDDPRDDAVRDRVRLRALAADRVGARRSAQPARLRVRRRCIQHPRGDAELPERRLHRPHRRDEGRRIRPRGVGPDLRRLNALDLGTDLAWDLFLGLWLLCIGVAMFRHSRLGARWAVPALALVPPSTPSTSPPLPTRRSSTSGPLSGCTPPP